MKPSLTAALPRALALALTVLFASACADKPSDPIAAGTAPAAAEADASDDEPMLPEGAFGSGQLSFELKPDQAQQLPVTFCAGQGTILTIAASEGEAQVDLRVIELPALRDGKPLIEVTEAGFRFTGTDQGRIFSEIWQTRSMDEVVRDGDTTRVRGKMYGLRSYDNGDGTGTSPAAVEGGAEREFILEVTCSP